MAEQITRLLKFGNIISLVIIGASMLVIIGYFMTMIFRPHPANWMIELGIENLIVGTAFYAFFLAIKIFATNIGII